MLLNIPPVAVAAAAAAALSQPGADLPGLADGEVEEGGAEGGAVGGVQERVDRRVAPSCDKWSCLYFNFACILTMTNVENFSNEQKCFLSL